MIALLAATVLSHPQMPAEPVRPAELRDAQVHMVVQATETHFVARNTSNATQLLLFGSPEHGVVSTVQLSPAERIVYPFARGAADDLLLEVVSMDRSGWRNTGALPVAALRRFDQGAVWIEVVAGYAIAWARGPQGFEHLAPTTGLLSAAVCSTRPGLVNYATAPNHVPVITPVDKKKVDRPPVLDENTLTPV